MISKSTIWQNANNQFLYFWCVVSYEIKAFIIDEFRLGKADYRSATSGFETVLRLESNHPIFIDRLDETRKRQQT